MILFVPLLALLAAAFLSPYRVPLFVAAGIWFFAGILLDQYRAAGLGTRYVHAYKSAVIPRLLTLIDPGLK